MIFYQIWVWRKSRNPSSFGKGRNLWNIFSFTSYPFVVSLINSLEILLYFFKISIKEKTYFWILFVAWEMILLNLGALIQFSLTDTITGRQLSFSAVSEGFPTTWLFIIYIFKSVKEFSKLVLFLIRGFLWSLGTCALRFWRNWVSMCKHKLECTLSCTFHVAVWIIGV